MKRHLPRDPDKEAREQATLLKSGCAFHNQELEQALAGAHGAIISELMDILDQLELDSAAALLDFMQRADWGSVGYDVRLTALHQINEHITALRERSGLPGISDPLPPAVNVFLRIKQTLFPPSPVKAGSEFSGQRSRPAAAYSDQSSDENR